MIRKILKRVRVQVFQRNKPKIKRYKYLVKKFNICLILDVGANTGQFALLMRALGYKEKIFSFEPVTQSYSKLTAQAKNDPNWETYNFALGSNNTDAVINISENTQSSSILNMLPLHIANAPNSVYISKETIEIKTLDSILEKHWLSDYPIMLKIDTQGYEMLVLEGAASSLDKISIIQLEMSLVPLYDGEILMNHMIAYLDSLGFYLHALLDGFSNKITGQLFQVDGIFVKKDL